jgi:acyl-[acyl-carrier-protein]-phospholipid O-acyltransferase / long-chain-fatty-acid--[acyl-carrier-protein] ligase
MSQDNTDINPYDPPQSLEGNLPLTGIAHREPPNRLWTGSFIGLLMAQALGTMNDNIFRWLVIGLAANQMQDQKSLFLTLGTIALTLPFILFAAPSGFFADRFPKARVIQWAKFAEIIIMGLGAVAIAIGEVYSVFIVLFLMGAQSALYSPARLGSIPELLHPEQISRANGWLGLTNLIAIIIGTVIGNKLADVYRPDDLQSILIIGAVIVGIALIGWLFSRRISLQPAGDPGSRFQWNFLATTWHDLRALWQQSGLLRVALGIMFFWSLGALANINIDQYVSENGGIKQILNDHKSAFLVCLTIGVGVGSVLAGYWSGNRVELGILPLGATGIVVCCLMLYGIDGHFFAESAGQVITTNTHYWGCIWLFGLGLSAGLFDIPLEAYMQQNSSPKDRGSILAANNFLTFGGIIAVSGLFYLLRRPVGEIGSQVPWYSAKEIFLLCGIGTIPVLFYIFWLLPQACLRFMVWMVTKLMYKIRVHGIEHVPAEGPALLVSNHISWLDAVLIILTCPRPVRMFAWAGNFENALMRKLANQWGVILVTNNPKSIRRALDTAHQALKQGEVVCIFPEGEISRGGNLQTFKPGMLKIINDTDAVVVPVFLDQLWGSIFSFDRGRFFWKWPRKWRYPVSVSYGSPLPGNSDIHAIRNAVQRLGSATIRQRMQEPKHIGADAIVGCKDAWRRSKIADSTGVDLTGKNTLLRTLALRRALRRELAHDEKNVGVLLPPTVPAIVTNLALSLDQRVVTNLNYTCTADILNYCLEEATIRTVVTSKKFLEKVDLGTLNAKLILLEDLREKVTTWDKIVAAVQTYLPAFCLTRWLGLHRTRGDEPITIIFTSGSTGKPKGVVLTHGNIASNVEAIDQVIHLGEKDVLLGILPLFHALGYTVTFWAGVTLQLKVAYHFSPLDAKQVGKLCHEHKATVLLSTPTFLRGYIRRCDAEELKTLNTVVTGAERLPDDVADAFQAKFGVLPIEGYGTTELSPLAAVNLPPSRAVEGFHPNRKAGTVGRPVPGVSAKILHPETGAELGQNESGLLWITGANVMQGYLHKPELTNEVLQDGWYCTGDMALIDEEGFIKITGRLSRFSKIGGEMVPHGAVEEALLKLINAGDAEQQPLAISAVPDEKKGERLVVLHTGLTESPADLCKKLAATGLPNLFIPGADSFYQVSELPVLGTGKLDLSAIKKLAQEVAK